MGDFRGRDGGQNRPQAVVLWASPLGGLPFLALAQARQEPFRPQDLPFALWGGALGVWLASRPEGRTKPLGPSRRARLRRLLRPHGPGGRPPLARRLTAFALVLLFFPQPKVHLPKAVPPWVLLAAQAGRLDVAASVSSFYPATTVALAWLFLGERLGPARALGVLLSLIALG
ncbi:EamA family transporter [Thermus sp. 2.9]|uniref:EamA family transporter n=1 Tax=Thermus sp. (strain 2.9) TaxID=1577051 RepID=UPI0006910F7C|nr:EamA family transporter [Thermus sp. 2.9]